MEKLIKFFEEMAEKCSIDWPMPLKSQLELITKKYDYKEEVLSVKIFDPDVEEIREVEKETLMFRFKDIVCKYRPHLQLGDIWVGILPIQKGKFEFICKSYEAQEDGTFELQTAQHPHIDQASKPCLGNFAPLIVGALSEGNIIRFFSQFKQYLVAYNGRSTFERGSYYTKLPIYYKM